MKQVLRYFRHAVASYPRQFCVAFFFIACVTAMNAFMPWGLRLFLELLSGENPYGILVIGILIFAVFLVVKTFMNMSWYTSLDKFAGKYMETLALGLEKRMAGTAYSEIEKIPGGTIRNILYSDVLNVFRVVGVFLPGVFSSVAVVVVSLVISLFFGVQVTLIILAAVILGMGLSWLSRKALAKTAGKTNKKLKILDAWCTQFVNMLPLIQSNDILAYYQRRTADNIDGFITTAMEEDKAIYFWQGLVNSYHTLFSIALSALLAIPQAGNPIVNLVFFTTISSLVMEHAQKIESTFQMIVRSLPSFEHVESLSTLPDSFGEAQAEPIESVEFDNVGFTYAGGVQALRQVNCKLCKGDCVLLRGANGSGKSTFIKLLTGLYLPTEGKITANKKALNHYARQSLNKQILYINQDEQCLNETFKAYLEIMSGQPLTEEKCRELVQFVQLPDDGRSIEGNGASLSVGQRKKLYVLKLLMRIDQASVVIVDELAAGMDTDAADRTYSLLQTMMQKKDKIFVLVEHVMPKDLPINKQLHFSDGSAHLTDDCSSAAPTNPGSSSNAGSSGILR